MSRLIRVGLLCGVLVLAACGTPQSEPPEESSTTTSEAVATTEAAPDTTVVEPTTTTSTEPAQSTTTTVAVDGDSDSLMAALDATSEVTSARIEGSIEMTGLDDSTTGISEAVILFSTAFDAATGNSSFLMDMSTLMGAVETDPEDPFAAMAAGMFSEMEVRQIGDISYVKFPFFTSMMGAETEWVSMPAEEGEDFAADFETMPTDPNDIISSFDREGASVEVVGTENVNGVDATHYRISLDTEQMDLSTEEQAELAESGVFVDGVIPLDIWISDDGYMVRMIMEIDGTGIDAPPGEEFERMTMSYDVFDVNGSVVIEAPPASDVTPVEDLEGAFGFDQ